MNTLSIISARVVSVKMKSPGSNIQSVRHWTFLPEMYHCPPAKNTWDTTNISRDKRANCQVQYLYGSLWIPKNNIDIMKSPLVTSISGLWMYLLLGNDNNKIKYIYIWNRHEYQSVRYYNAAVLELDYVIYHFVINVVNSISYHYLFNSIGSGWRCVAAFASDGLGLACRTAKWVPHR